MAGIFLLLGLCVSMLPLFVTMYRVYRAIQLTGILETGRNGGCVRLTLRPT